MLEKCGEVYYKIGGKSSRKSGRIVHINSLKQWNEEFNVSRLDVVLQDESDEKSEPLLEGVCKWFDQVELDSLLHEMADVFSDTPGLASGPEMTINTGEAPPIGQHSYSVPVMIREKVKNEFAKVGKSRHH